MTASIRAFVVTVPVEDVDRASDALWQLGVRAIEERVVDGGTVDGGTVDGGTVELRTSVGQDDEAVARAAATLDPAWTWRTEDVSTVSAETWREFARANWITDDLVVVPEWLDLEVGESVTRISIEPAGAFGLGDHPTSQLCARVLRGVLADLATDRGRSVDVLDVGCGTGVLAIVAAASGARSVRAIDVSAEAVAATAANARLNGVSDLIEVDDASVQDIAGTFDIVAANILAPVLIASAPELRRVTAPDGKLVISGILADAHDHVLDALRPMAVVATAVQENWAAVTLTH